ncbi:MAG TPA: hypothetical protein VGC54_03725 [Planctomycetota bacterium]
MGNGNPAKPFGITYERYSGRLFVGVAGQFFADNDVVALLDPDSKAVLGTLQAGLFPEDVAFAYDQSGRPTFGAVTNSTSGSVTVWDANTDAVVATVRLPDPQGFGTAYPFGIAASPGGGRFHVTTQDGSGAVYALDLADLALDPAAAFQLGGNVAGGRPLAVARRLFVPATFQDPAFTGSLGGIAAVDLGAGGVAWSRQLVDRRGAFQWPSSQAVVALADGRLILGGTGFEGRLYVLEQDGTLQRTLRIGTPQGSAHGLALSPDESLLVVCDLAGNSLAVIDLLNMEEIAVIDLTAIDGTFKEPNAAVFVGAELFVTLQGKESVLVFDDFPAPLPGGGFAGALTVSDSAPALGGAFAVGVSGPGRVAILASTEDTAAVVAGVALLLGPAPAVQGSAAGAATRTYTIPSNPAFRGRHFFFQGVVDVFGAPRATAPRMIVVQ